ncbi:MAG: sugar transferase [Pirellulaceae bacterium]|nr:sugar transferase [Pirellulaceae bacterium]
MKRIFDFFGSIFLLIALSPILLMAMVAVRLKMGSPVFFRQQRPGKDGKPFEMIKLRSMLGTVDSRGEPLPDEKRLTRLGKFLRSTSIDEFPALWNVIKGEMSLVGPRPLLMEYLPLYNERQNRRHDVKPGITGWAQVNGRNAISWEDKFELDVWYVENRSLLLDLKILFLTVWKVFKRDGISAPGQATTSYFKGNTKS